MAKVHQIYFIRRGDGLVKIGYTTSVRRRMAELQRNHGDLELIRVIHGDLRRENQIHVKCKRHNEFGEWFRDSPGLRAIIASLPEGDAVEASTSSEKKAWLEFQNEVSERLHKDAKTLVMLEYAMNGNLMNEAIISVSQRYGIPYNTLHRLHYGRAQTVSAAMLEKVRLALSDMRQRHIDALLSEVETIRDQEPALEAELDLSEQIKSLRSRFEAVRDGLAA